MKNRIWLVGFALIFLASCQTSRFMQDDMYFSDIDAKREVREYELSKKSTTTENSEAVKSDVQPTEDEIAFANNSETNIKVDDYYDYTYSSRIKRFNTPNNTWSYYDPYYTNYYWYNSSSSSYFGNSVYSTYRWWEPNAANHTNSYAGYGRWNPFGPYANNSQNNGVCFNTLYYNSFDNNCYAGFWKVDSTHTPSIINPTNFVMLMQNNGITRDVIQRPAINYTAIREANNATLIITDDKTNIEPTVNDQSTDISADKNNVTTDKTNTNNNTVVVTNNYPSDDNKTTNTSKGNTNSSNTNNNTTKRWDNHNEDVNISPNTNNNSNWSRSGVFSEGSRNNNYQYNGTINSNNKGTNSNNGGTQNDKIHK